MRLPVPLKKEDDGGFGVQAISPSTVGSNKLAFITQADNLIKTQTMLIRMYPLYKGDGNE